MKTQSILLIIMLQFFYLASFSQFKIANSGNIGIGTNNMIEKLNVQGGLSLTANNNVFCFRPNNPGTEIGSSTGSIIFWYTTTGPNNLYASHYLPFSDSTLKLDILPLDSSIEILIQLNGRKYHFKPILDSTTNELRYDTAYYDYGFIAQEVEQILPGIVKEVNGYKLNE